MILINRTNLTPEFVAENKQEINSLNHWHKIYVSNCKTYSKEYVLDAIMKAVSPNDFIPVSYKIEGENVAFYLKNCGGAIAALCDLNLQVNHPDIQADKSIKPFEIAILLKFISASAYTVDIEPNLKQVIKKRFNAVTKELNLERFSKDPDLIEFCPLSQPKLLYYVLSLSKELNYTKLILRNNDIEVLSPLEALDKNKLCSIDLSKNSIKTTKQFTALKGYSQLSSLIINDNPFLNTITDIAHQNLIKTYCVKQKKEFKKVPIAHKNYVVNSQVSELIDQFMLHYFTLFDTDRQSLENLYHHQALFSITAQYVAGQSTSQSARLVDFKRISRNIKCMGNFTKKDERMYYSPTSIVQAFALISKTNHDPYMFCVDCTYSSDTTIIFCISGVFKEVVENVADKDRLYNFLRFFTLMKVAPDEWKIVNEHLSVANASTRQAEAAFHNALIHKTIKTNIPVPKSMSEREDMILCLMTITCMRYEWAKKCLESTYYNLQRALEMFVETLKQDMVPVDAFNVVHLEFTKENEAGPLSPTPVGLNEGLQIESSLPILQQQPPVVKKINSINIATTANVPIQPSLSSPAIVPAPVTPAPTSRSSFQPKPNQFALDPAVAMAINMPPDTNEMIAKVRLDTASKVVIEKYTFVMKHYKAIGKEFYKFKFFAEAREFLKQAMAVLTTNLAEEIYSVFTLYEFQYGDFDEASKMVVKTAETYPIGKTVKLISEHIAKINIGYSRQMFETTIALKNLPQGKLDALNAAYKAFKTIHNDKAPENKNLEEEKKKIEEEKQRLEEEKRKLEAERQRQEEERKQLELAKRELDLGNNPPTAVNNDKLKVLSNIVLNTLKKPLPINTNEIIELDSDTEMNEVKRAENKTATPDFIPLETEVVKEEINIDVGDVSAINFDNSFSSYLTDINETEVDELEDFRRKYHALLKLSPWKGCSKKWDILSENVPLETKILAVRKILVKEPKLNRFFFIELCKAGASLDILAELITISKTPVTQKNGYYFTCRAIILMLQLLSDNKRRPTFEDQMGKIITFHIERCSKNNVHIIFLDVELIGKLDLLQIMYESCFHPACNIELPKLKYIFSMYEWFCRKRNIQIDPKLQEKFTESFTDKFHPSMALSSSDAKEIREWYTSNAKLEQSAILERKMPQTIECTIEKVRALLYHKHISIARKQMQQLITLFNIKSDQVKFFVACIVLEASFGDTKVASNKLERTPYKYPIYYRLPKIHIMMVKNNVKGALTTICEYNDHQLISVAYVESLFMYYKEWKSMFNVDLFDLPSVVH